MYRSHYHILNIKCTTVIITLQKSNVQKSNVKKYYSGIIRLEYL